MKISNWKICRNVAKRIRFHSFYNSQDVSRKYDFLFPPPIQPSFILFAPEHLEAFKGQRDRVEWRDEWRGGRGRASTVINFNED